MTIDEALKSLLRDFHKTRVTQKVSVDAEALGRILYELDAFSYIRSSDLES